MIALLKDFNIGFDPKTRRFVVELKFGGLRVVFQADLYKLIQLRHALDQTIKNVPPVESDTE